MNISNDSKKVIIRLPQQEIMIDHGVQSQQLNRSVEKNENNTQQIRSSNESIQNQQHNQLKNNFQTLRANQKQNVQNEQDSNPKKKQQQEHIQIVQNQEQELWKSSCNPIFSRSNNFFRQQRSIEDQQQNNQSTNIERDEQIQVNKCYANQREESPKISYTKGRLLELARVLMKNAQIRKQEISNQNNNQEQSIQAQIFQQMNVLGFYDQAILEQIRSNDSSISAQSKDKLQQNNKQTKLKKSQTNKQVRESNNKQKKNAKKNINKDQSSIKQHNNNHEEDQIYLENIQTSINQFNNPKKLNLNSIQQDDIDIEESKSEYQNEQCIQINSQNKQTNSAQQQQVQIPSNINESKLSNNTKFLRKRENNSNKFVISNQSLDSNQIDNANQQNNQHSLNNQNEFIQDEENEDRNVFFQIYLNQCPHQRNDSNEDQIEIEDDSEYNQYEDECNQHLDECYQYEDQEQEQEYNYQYNIQLQSQEYEEEEEEEDINFDNEQLQFDQEQYESNNEDQQYYEEGQEVDDEYNGYEDQESNGYEQSDYNVQEEQSYNQQEVFEYEGDEYIYEEENVSDIEQEEQEIQEDDSHDNEESEPMFYDESNQLFFEEINIPQPLPEGLQFAFNIQQEQQDYDEYEPYEQSFNAHNNGLTKAEILSIPTVVYTTQRIRNKVKKQYSTQQDCSICLSNYLDKEILRVLPCEHRFHSQCIDKWLLQNSKCVVCKFDLLNNNND